MKYDNGAQGWNGRIIVDYTVKNYLVLLIYVVHHFLLGEEFGCVFFTLHI